MNQDRTENMPPKLTVSNQVVSALGNECLLVNAKTFGALMGLVGMQGQSAEAVVRALNVNSLPVELVVETKEEEPKPEVASRGYP